MVRRDIIVVGASAGGVETLFRLVKVLPADFPAAILVAVHVSASGPSMLPNILSRAGLLPVSHPKDQDPIVQGQIYIAPPDYHLLIQTDRLHLGHGPRENGFRPSIDVLFRSAAYAYGPRVVGVILSGALDDGTAGLAIVKAHGGVALVQDPDEAMFKGMPQSAIQHINIDGIFKIDALAEQLSQLVQASIEESVIMPEPESAIPLDQEAKIVAKDKEALERGERPGQPSPMTCPDCGGVLWELQNDGLLRFRCHVGHVYSLDSLASEQADAVEIALWSAVRALEEKAALARRMAFQAKQQNRSISEAQFNKRAQEVEEHAARVREILLITQQKMEIESQKVPKRVGE